MGTSGDRALTRMKNSALSTEVTMYSDEDQQNYEDWMASLPEELWDVPLSSLAIPGNFIQLHANGTCLNEFIKRPQSSLSLSR